MITCSNCGRNNNDEAEYCSSCGQKLAVQSHKQDEEEMHEEKPWYKKYLTAIIALCFIGLFLAVAVNYAGPADYTMSARQFANEYCQNAPAASAKYNTKIVRLNGRVLEKGRFTNSDDIYINLYYLSGIVQVLACFDIAQKNAVNNVKKGDFITVQGEVDGVVPQHRSNVISIQISNSKIIN